MVDKNATIYYIVNITRKVIMKKIITLILVAMALIGCNEVKTEVATVQSEEVHDGLYKKLKFHRCKMDIFNLMTEKDKLVNLLDKNDPFTVNLFAVGEEVQNTQDTLALFYACDRLIK